MTNESKRNVSGFQQSRRGFLALSGAAIGGIAAGRLLPAAAARLQESGEITVYSGRNENLVGPVFDLFTAATGIKVNARYGDTAEMAAAILEEGKNSPADLYLAQDAGALGAIEAEGLFSPLPESLISRVDPKFQSDTGGWIGITGRARVAVYNTDLLPTDTLPASVNGFLDPEWKGIVGWAPSNGSFQSFVTAYRVLEGDDAARTWLEGMIANEVVTFDGNDAITRAVGTGEISVGLVNHYYIYEVEAEEGETLPAANHYFEGGDPGSLVNVSGIGILATTEKADEAESLIDFLLQTEAQTYFATEVWEYPLIPDVDISEGLIPLAEIQSPKHRSFGSRRSAGNARIARGNRRTLNEQEKVSLTTGL